MKFEIFAKGDPTVGDGDHHATVDIPFMVTGDEEYGLFVVSQLESAFSDIFDSRAKVVKVDGITR